MSSRIRLRGTVRRWRRLASIVRSMERAFGASCRLDAYEHRPLSDEEERERHLAMRTVEKFLDRLEATVGQELAVLTCELLDAQLETRKIKHERDRVRMQDLRTQPSLETAAA